MIIHAFSMLSTRHYIDVDSASYGIRVGDVLKVRPGAFDEERTGELKVVDIGPSPHSGCERLYVDQAPRAAIPAICCGDWVCHKDDSLFPEWIGLEDAVAYIRRKDVDRELGMVIRYLRAHNLPKTAAAIERRMHRVEPK